MMSAPYDRGLLYFAVWSFITTFLVAFQGFFAALFYCFLNGEVGGGKRTVSKKQNVVLYIHPGLLKFNRFERSLRTYLPTFLISSSSLYSICKIKGLSHILKLFCTFPVFQKQMK